ncbi:MAG TPA: hypothetical protein PLU30_22220 [Verrucomicrobiae bacterium]|nr:hypothetical protein [Verrucomicrobiae bacterium]
MPAPPPTDADHPGGFLFERDTFYFPNELVWEYRFETAAGPPVVRRRIPPPTYSHHCFVLVRSARQFLYHASFEPSEPPVDPASYRERIRNVVSRNPRVPAKPGQRIPFPGFRGLREFSQQHERLLKCCCGGAWQSYVLRSHWRMVLPISRNHQKRTAAQLTHKIQSGIAPIVHLVRFPQLTINHGMILFSVTGEPDHLKFAAYDPNVPERPSQLTYDARSASFSMPRNSYWKGGSLDAIEIYHGWLY